MDLLSLLIGALVGWLIGWLLDYLVCRPRRMAAQVELSNRLEQCNEECTLLREQLNGYQDLQVRLDAAHAELGALKTQVDGLPDLQARLDGANSQVAERQAQLDGLKDVQVQLEGANLEIDSLKAQLGGLKGVQADLVSWKAAATQKDLEIERLNAELAARAQAARAAAVGVAAAAEEVAHVVSPEPKVEAVDISAPLTAEAVQPVELDDLTIIEGIGPKINALLNQDGIYTFAQLATAAVERLQSILAAAGPRFRLADPHSWPEQAALARDGSWDALQALQSSLKAGRGA